ncbi:MAG: hypothetical protein B6I20_08785 [Bacteroidetes bacterium 4572_117]|nr:MAG: hypothetical protein B6I20_08785 [Bacteroidetes bacterium 4572_117]
MAYYINLPPLIHEQRTAIMLPNPVALSGGPGMGKSLVPIYKHSVASLQTKNRNADNTDLTDPH